MARAQALLAQVRNPRCYADQTAALRALKNETVGHVQKKERWVELGVLEPIVKALATSRPPVKMNGKDSRSNHAPPRPVSEEELARLQALELLAVFASGGPPFLAPLHASGSLPAILSNLSPFENHPKLVFAALRALINLTEASTLVLSPYPVDTATLADAIFVPQHLDSLYSILVSTSSAWISQNQVNMVARLISLLCREERHQMALANSGILEALATKLTSFVVAQGQVVPGSEAIAQNDGLADWIPQPAPPSIKLSGILEAISVIIADSRLRACMLLYSPSIMAVFPHLSFDTSLADIRAAWKALDTGGLNGSPLQNLGALDYLLPAVPSQQSKASLGYMSSYPTLGPIFSRDTASSASRALPGRFGSNLSGWDSSRFESTNNGNDSDAEEPESPMIPWLINLVRSSEGMERLMATSILASLYKSGFASRCRETAMGLLVVPLLLQMLSDLDSGVAPADATWADAETSSRWAIAERTAAILARLITDSEYLQKAAFDCNAIKVVSKLLKDAYEPLPVRSSGSRPWNPSVEEEDDGGRERGLPSCTLGPPGQLPIQAHRARLRESGLKAIAALISFKDDYRKAFVDEDVIAYVVESLIQNPTRPRSVKERIKSPKESDAPGSAEVDPAYGSNPVGVLIAACHTVRMLSRSVSILRTTLEDAGAAMPIFRLLRHPEIEVQIAATGAICNLVTEVSPMRERYSEAGIMKILCEHARSTNAPLRLNALWALKHFVHGVGAEMKKRCLEELQPGWLVQLICDDTEDDALFLRTKNNEKQAAIPTSDDMDEDIEMDQAEEDGKSWQASSSSALHRASFPRTSHERSRTGRLRQAEAKIAALRETELNPVRKARSDDLAIQEQGLNFIRNLIGPGGSHSSMDTINDTTEMIDYLFSELGQDRLFEILGSKLKVKVLHPFSRRVSAGQSTRVLYPQAKIIEAVVFILVHISASVPRHRQLVIAQTDLLKALVPHFSSKDKDVRVALCHLLSNLTWRDDTNDTQAAGQRALELRRLGLLTKLEALEQEDTELDVRERAKTAIYQMSQQNYS